MSLGIYTYIYAYVIEAILRGISSFFIIRLALRATQGIIVEYYGLPTIFRSFAFLVFCFVIVATPMGVLFPSLSFSPLPLSPIFLPWPLTPVLPVCLDIGRMFLLTWVVWRHYMKHKVNRRRHFLFKKQRPG
jgi:hypothetical protein